MGNYQKILLAVLAVTVTIVITLFAIKTFSNTTHKTNIKQVKKDLLIMAAAARGYFMRPTMLDGGGTEFTNIQWSTMGDVGCVVDSYNANLCINENGRYIITTVNQDSITISADPLQIEGSEMLEIIIYADTAKFTGNNIASDG